MFYTCRVEELKKLNISLKHFRAGSGNVVGSTGPGSTGNSGTSINGGGLSHKGPDEDKIKEILERTGYTLDVTTGQRKFGGPPPGWEGEAPSKGCEVSSISFSNIPTPVSRPKNVFSFFKN